MSRKTELSRRARYSRLFLFLSAALLFVYGLLPVITRHIPVLRQMASHLEQNGIDPTRYYYTDVEQVREAEDYMKSALKGR